MENKYAEAHHVLFNRKPWDSQEATKELRRRELLIPKLEPITHRILHENVLMVPLLDHFTSRLVARELENGYDNLSSIYKLMSTINKVADYDCVPYLSSELAQLSVYAIEQQIPYIRDGLMEPKR